MDPTLNGGPGTATSFDADVIVAGAGPAGAVAAIVLAEAGRRVILCDRRQFPRDKACGDGLIADSINALQTLGLAPGIFEAAHRATRLRLISPGGIEVAFNSTFYVLPRRVLDHMLVERAIAAGTEFRQLIVDRPVQDGNQVVGIRAERPDTREPVTLRAPLTVLATGGASDVLKKFDEGARVTPSGYAVRTYAGTSGDVLSDLIISLERDLLPGYAWAFPAPGGMINLGLGVVGRTANRNLRVRLDALVAGAGRLGSLLGPTMALAPYQGAPLRTNLEGASLGRPGLAIVGEAAGTTYAVSGEGIGKAMESALLIGELASSPHCKLPLLGLEYAVIMRQRYGPRFKGYAIGQKWIRFPWLADYVARRARQSLWVHDRLTGIVNEQHLPNSVFSARALWRLATSR